MYTIPPHRMFQDHSESGDCTSSQCEALCLGEKNSLLLALSIGVWCVWNRLINVNVTAEGDVSLCVPSLPTRIGSPSSPPNICFTGWEGNISEEEGAPE